MGYRIITQKIQGKHWYRGFYYTTKSPDGKLIWDNPPNIEDTVGLAGLFVMATLENGKLFLSEDTEIRAEHDKRTAERKAKRRKLAQAIARLSESSGI